MFLIYDLMFKALFCSLEATSSFRYWETRELACLAGVYLKASLGLMEEATSETELESKSLSLARSSSASSTSKIWSCFAINYSARDSFLIDLLLATEFF